MPENSAEARNVFYRKLAPFILFTAVLLWGYSYIVTKNILGVTSPLVLTSVAYIYSGIAGIPVLLSRRRYLGQKGIWKQSIVLGLLLYIARLVQVFGCELTTAGKNAFITSAYVVIVPILGWALLRQKLQAKNIILALLTLTGIGIIALNDHFTGFNSGDLLTFAASVGFGIHIIYNGKYVEKNDPLLLGVLQLEVAAVISLILMLLLRPQMPADFYTLNLQIPFLYSGALSTMLGFLLQSFGQKYLEPNRTALIISLESVSGAVFSAALLGEKYGVRLLIGCAIVLAANILSNIRRQENQI
ncbi:MAG TPA: DMT family transporter [Caproiciproducens sp.]|nr:DMT family transporter [Caproiciproducens sp.]